MSPEPQELKEYQYVVNNTVTTAMLTPKMAERLGAKEVGSEPTDLNGGYSAQQNQAVYSASDMNTGVTGEGAVDPVRPQQKGVDKKGRTPSMRRTISDIPEAERASYEPQDADAPTDADATSGGTAGSTDAATPQPAAPNKTRRPLDK